ncbi:MAG TPA: hypothetical protein VKU85_11260, partial [bacterium]|nr:hypothetical protein [bacterium]
MIAAVRATLVTGFVVLMSASTVAAEPRLPGLGRFSVDLVEAARRQSAAEPPAEHGEFELPSDPVAERREEEWARSRQVSRLANDDNDATHYARGRCLIMNIFIDHANGTWSEAERDTMAARHSVAKDHYLSVAPPEANLDFDNVGSTFYWQYTVSIPDSIVDEGFTWDHTEQALDALGFTDDDGDGQIIDDFNFFFQEWNGGWDNVLASFQAADVTGRAFANSAWSRVRQYTDDSANVRAHEWGHLFGACDEYVGGSGTCAGGIDCGPCQSDYLLSVIDNGNCNLTSCPTNVPCLMDNNVFTGLCDYTLNHFAWWDDDGNGQLDRVRRRVSGETFADIWELWDGGWFQWNSVSHGMVYHQNDRAWAVAGVRSP